MVIVTRRRARAVREFAFLLQTKMENLEALRENERTANSEKSVLAREMLNIVNSVEAMASRDFFTAIRDVAVFPEHVDIAENDYLLPVDASHNIQLLLDQVFEGVFARGVFAEIAASAHDFPARQMAAQTFARKLFRLECLLPERRSAIAQENDAETQFISLVQQLQQQHWESVLESKKDFEQFIRLGNDVASSFPNEVSFRKFKKMFVCALLFLLNYMEEIRGVQNRIRLSVQIWTFAYAGLQVCVRRKEKKWLKNLPRAMGESVLRWTLQVFLFKDQVDKVLLREFVFRSCRLLEILSSAFSGLSHKSAQKSFVCPKEKWRA